MGFGVCSEPKGLPRAWQLSLPGKQVELSGIAEGTTYEQEINVQVFSAFFLAAFSQERSPNSLYGCTAPGSKMVTVPWGWLSHSSISVNVSFLSEGAW